MVENSTIIFARLDEKSLLFPIFVNSRYKLVLVRCGLKFEERLAKFTAPPEQME